MKRKPNYLLNTARTNKPILTLWCGGSGEGAVEVFQVLGVGTVAGLTVSGPLATSERKVRASSRSNISVLR